MAQISSQEYKLTLAAYQALKKFHTRMLDISQGDFEKEGSQLVKSGIVNEQEASLVHRYFFQEGFGLIEKETYIVLKWRNSGESIDRSFHIDPTPTCYVRNSQAPRKGNRDDGEHGIIYPDPDFQVGRNPGSYVYQVFPLTKELEDLPSGSDLPIDLYFSAIPKGINDVLDQLEADTTNQDVFNLMNTVLEKGTEKKYGFLPPRKKKKAYTASVEGSDYEVSQENNSSLIQLQGPNLSLSIDSREPHKMEWEGDKFPRVQVFEVLQALSGK